MHLLGLAFLVTGSAASVVYQNYYFRDLFMEIRLLEAALDNGEVESGQLQLEKMTLAGYGRIENTARAQMGLIRPPRESIVYLKPSRSMEVLAGD
ncbi:MAG: cell division protein FtsL [Pseudomonadota bacterium]|nr:cell division protein FtsL [Pseudomonadota bacterium]